MSYLDNLARLLSSYDDDADPALSDDEDDRPSQAPVIEVRRRLAPVVPGLCPCPLFLQHPFHLTMRHRSALCVRRRTMKRRRRRTRS